MRGIFIHNQLEYRLEVTGEDFYQGDSLPCTLSVKNHSSETQPLSALSISLALGNFTKIKQKADCAYSVILSSVFNELGSLEAQEQKSFSWTVELDKNCVITDKNQSLFLLYGNPDIAEANAQLLVTVQPHRYIHQILTTLESTFQFVFKGQKSANGWLNVKLKPSSSRRLSLVDELVLGFHFEENAIMLKYMFKVKRFDTTVSTVTVKKGKTEVEQTLPLSEFLLTSEHLNLKSLEAKIDEALAVVATGL